MKKNEVITTSNNAVIDNNTLASAMDKLGLSYTTHTETEKGAIAVKTTQKVDGEDTEVTIYVTDDKEKAAIRALDALTAVNEYLPAKQCAVFAYVYELGTWKNNGCKKFSDYAMAINNKLSDSTIRKYLNIGLCFFKSGTIEPEWVDERLKGVSVNNLDKAISHFKAWAKSKEIGGEVANYRDHVPAYLDTFFSPEDGVELIHLKANQPTIVDDIAKLSGKATTEEKKNEKKNKKSDNSDNLSAKEALELAIANYTTDESANAEVVALLDKVSALLAK